MRTSLNLPIALVRDEHTGLPFDTSGIDIYAYDSNLRGWEIEQQREALAKHIIDSAASCGGQNPLWRQFGLTMRASEPSATESPFEAKVDLLASHLLTLEEQLVALVHQSRKFGGISPAEHFVDALVASDQQAMGLEQISTSSWDDVAINFKRVPNPADVDRIRWLASRIGVNLIVTSPAGAESFAAGPMPR